MAHPTHILYIFNVSYEKMVRYMVRYFVCLVYKKKLHQGNIRQESYETYRNSCNPMNIICYIITNSIITKEI